MYNVNLEVFQGPLDLLLHLIEKMEIDIDNLQKIRAQFLDKESMNIEEEGSVETLRMPSSKLLQAMENILRSLEDKENEVSLVSYRREVSFEQVKEELVNKFKNKRNMSFFDLIKSYSQKNEVVLVFMGILAMIKDQELLCVDNDSEIILEYKSKEN